MEDTHTYFNLLSRMLQYPDESYLQGLPQLEAAAGRLPRGEPRVAFEKFMCHLRAQNPFQLQERYTAAFDLNPATTLNMTYHIWGDGEKRAGALTRLRQIYHDAGYETTTGELPDYLPLMLEFVSIFPAARHIGLIQQCLKALETVVARLRQIVPPYAELLQPLIGICNDQKAARIH